MKICIVGGGLLPYFLARSLSAKGHSVTIINKDGEECDRFARRLKAVVVHGDGTHPAVLQDAGVDAMDAVLAITPHDEENFLICQIIQVKYKIPYVFALLNDPDNEEVVRELGIPAVFSPTRIISSLIEQQVGYESITNLSPLADGKVNLTEIILPDSSPALGKEIRELKLPQGCLIVSLLRDDEVVIPHGDTQLRSMDRVGIVSIPKSYPTALAILTGEKGI